MARGTNKVILIGNLGKAPELKTFENGGRVCNVSLATSEVWKDKEGNSNERTEWHNLVFKNGLADIANKYLDKGSRIYVEGSIRSRTYTDKENIERRVYEIHCFDMNMLDAKKSDGTPLPADAGAPQKDDDIPF